MLAFKHVLGVFCFTFPTLVNLIFSEITNSSQQYEFRVPTGNDYQLLGTSFGLDKKSFGYISGKLSQSRYKLAAASSTRAVFFAGGNTKVSDSAVVDIFAFWLFLF